MATQHGQGPFPLQFNSMAVDEGKVSKRVKEETTATTIGSTHKILQTTTDCGIESCPGPELRRLYPELCLSRGVFMVARGKEILAPSFSLFSFQTLCSECKNYLDLISILDQCPVHHHIQTGRIIFIFLFGPFQLGGVQKNNRHPRV